VGVKGANEMNYTSLYICVLRCAIMENTHALQSFGRISFRLL